MMTEKEKYTFIKNNVLRRAFRRWYAYSACLYAARVARDVPTASGRGLKKEVTYQCAHCQGMFRRKDVCVDHIVPIVGPEGWDGDWNSIVNGMYCDVDGLQVLCNWKGEREIDGVKERSCHYKKTKLERDARTAHRRALKANKLKKNKLVKEKP